jgi:hypothetical protein
MSGRRARKDQKTDKVMEEILTRTEPLPSLTRRERARLRKQRTNIGMTTGKPRPDTK